jgi:hypothetical protein
MTATNGVQLFSNGIQQLHTLCIITNFICNERIAQLHTDVRVQFALCICALLFTNLMYCINELLCDFIVGMS